MLRELHVLHLDEATLELPAPLAVIAASGEALVMHTCQRTVALFDNADAVRNLSSQLGNASTVVCYQDAAAYEFLLKLSCGLQSRLSGETEIFGQIKKCWQEFSLRDMALASQLDSTMQRLFRDVKEVRSRFLSGLGSASYGSLVRRLLDEAAPAGRGQRPVLLIGAGQIAHAVAPWIKGSELWIWNRSRAKAQELAVEVQRRSPERVVKVLDSDDESELAAWRLAADVVVCVPADAERDAARAAAWLASGASGGQSHGQLIHLGVESAARAPQWSNVSGMLDLSAVYELLRASNEQRRLQLEHARAACRVYAAAWSPARASAATRKRSHQSAANRLNS